MTNRIRHIWTYCIYFLSWLLILEGCKPEGKKVVEPVMFETLDHNRTRLEFSNKLKPTADFNVFKYMYFYNGSGVAAGDFNNDGKIDLFFASNQGKNSLFLNKGDLKFEDVTDETQIVQDGGWSTGASVVDINNDGLLDIYVSRVGKYSVLNSHNLFLICQGINKNGVPTYKEMSKELGVNFSGFSTQAAFLDYDMDGDLDLFLVNHSIHQNGTFGPRTQFLGTYHPLSGDRLYRNDGNKFTDVTHESKINSSAICYGLGVAVADINLDGYPDLYVSNDFHENDYLYINQRDGTFKEETGDRLMHTSQFSMGADVADINNDGFDDIVTTDMLPSDPYILKRSFGEDEYNIFKLKIGMGYNYQFTRNMLQLNRRNGMFSEVGLFAGVFATDWSWSCVWLDFDNDGSKDLFVSNGIPKRLNDIDYINYVSNEQIQKRIKSEKLDEKDLSLTDKFPEIKLPNMFYRNEGAIKFQDVGSHVEGNIPTYSNGSVYADLDNDGDLDIVVNNIEDHALLYRNTSNDKKEKPSLEITLKGPASNVNAVGSKVIVFANNGIRTYEKFPTRGYMSSMETPVCIGLDKSKIDSILLVWPDNTYQPVAWKQGAAAMTISYTKGLPSFDYSVITNHWVNTTRPVLDITAGTKLQHKHAENYFNEFDREPLMPHMVSTEGPALAVGDVNHDGLDDIFIGSSKWTKSVLYIQKPGGIFYKSVQPALDKDSTYEDVDACFADVNNDGKPDLIVASGGNEYYGPDDNLLSRVYLNDGKGNFERNIQAIQKIYMTASCVVPYDFNGDGYIDLFLGGRAVPWAYGQTPGSCLLQNDGKGNFTDVTDQYAPGLAEAGMVTRAVWVDMNNDGQKDLVLSLEWGGIIAWMNNKGAFTKKEITNVKGWWNFVLPVDIDHDGDIDFIAGNLGLNSRLKASVKEPIRMYYYDFDGNGKKEQVVTYYLDGKEIPFANKEELERQMPSMKKKFLYAEDFAKASLSTLFSTDTLKKADTLTANYLANAVIINNSNMNFTVQEMPWLAQLTTFRDAAVVDANGDDLPDILLGGNFYDNNIEMGRYDADFGTLLVNRGKGQFSCESLNGLAIKGQIRHIAPIKLGKNENAYILVRNNDSTMVIRFK